MKKRKEDYLAQSQSNLRIKESVKTVKVKNEAKGLLLLQVNRCGNSTVTQNKSKGPPGIRPSPEDYYCSARGHPPEAILNQCSEYYPKYVEGEIVNNKKGNNYHIKQNFLTQLNFTIMKKHLFFLIVAFFAIGVAKSYGQLKPHAINCLPADALHPVAGQDYTYQIDVPVTPSPGDAWTSMKYLWFATQLNLNAPVDNMFIDASGNLRAASDPGNGTGNFIATASSDYSASGTAAAGADNILTITWKNIVYDAKKPIFVVIQTLGNNGICDVNNLKVFKIEPIIAFTVDIDNLQTDGTAHTAPDGTAATSVNYGDVYKQCISDVVTANYDETSGKVIYDFGKNYLLYEVVAANWSTSWNLGLKLKGVDPLETITVEWSKDKTFATGVHTMTGPANSTATTDLLAYTNAIPADNVTATIANGNVGALGESIFIRVTLDHSVSGKPNYEGLADQNVVVYVHGMTNWDATLATPAFTIPDVDWNNSGTSPNCTALVPDNYDTNIANQDVKARPTIINTVANPMPAPGLVPMMTPNP